MKPLRILQIVSGRNVNGAVLYCKLLSEHLVERGHKVTVLFREGSWIEKQFNDSAVGQMTSNLKRFPTGELSRIAAWVRRNDIDVIHTHMSSGHTFGILLKMMSGIPVVATAHTRSFQLHWRLNDFVIANSDATFNFQRRVNFVPAQRMQTVHCFPDLERCREIPERGIRAARKRLHLKGGEFVVGVVGEVVPRKGHIYLFRALSRMVEAIPNLRLAVIGRFSRHEPCAQMLRKHLIKEGLFRRVRWLGIRQSVHYFLKVCDLTVVPSIEEPLGLVAIESLATGTPVVATNVGGLPEIVQHEKTGLLVPAHDSNAIADAVIRMASDEQFRIQTAEAGRKLMYQKFDADNLTRQVEEIFDQVISAKKRAA